MSLKYNFTGCLQENIMSCSGCKYPIPARVLYDFHIGRYKRLRVCKFSEAFHYFLRVWNFQIRFCRCKRHRKKNSIYIYKIKIRCKSFKFNSSDFVIRELSLSLIYHGDGICSKTCLCSCTRLKRNLAIDTSKSRWTFWMLAFFLLL